jgi:ABC-2 type transport system permease protein
MMFLPYLSCAFVPISSMPSWLHGFANNQPTTPVIESIRGLLLNAPLRQQPWRALAWYGAILVASVALCSVLFRRRTA